MMTTAEVTEPMVAGVQAAFASWFTIFDIVLHNTIIPSPRIISVSKLILCTKCVFLKLMTSQQLVTKTFKIVSTTAITYHAIYVFPWPSEASNPRYVSP